MSTTTRPRPRPADEDQSLLKRVDDLSEKDAAAVEARRKSFAERANQTLDVPASSNDGGRTLRAEQKVARLRNYDKRQEIYNRLSEALSIDKMRLDDEVMQMPSCLQEAGEHCAHAIARREAAAHGMKVVTAQIAAKLRATDLNGKPRSEANINSEIPLTDEFREVNDEHEECRREAAMWQVLVNSWEVKRSALRIMGDLINSGYVSSASITDDRRRAMADARSKQRE